MITIILFNSIATLIILFVVWWFWLAKGKSTQVKENMSIIGLTKNDARQDITQVKKRSLHKSK